MLGVGVIAALTVSCLPAAPAGAGLPTWSPSGDEIAYTVPAHETGQIEIAKPGAIRPFEDWLSYESAPERLSWSPVGDEIAYQVRTGAISVFTPGRFAASRELVQAGGAASTELDDWSPDGRALLYVRDFQVFVVDVATGERRYLAGGAHAAWSPDGLEIAIGSGQIIYGIRPDGTGLRTIADVDTSVTSLAWSPDSTRLAFVGKVIGLVARFGGEPAYTVPAEPPIAWRPDGIFYNLTRVAPVQTSVWRFDPNTGDTTQLTHLPIKFDARFSAASPDGSRIAYELDIDYLPATVRVVDGGRDQPLLACHGTSRRDTVRGARLNDLIRVNGGGRDRVSCGRGNDVVYADRRDVIARDCETVTRLP